jgi:dimethylargininase
MIRAITHSVSPNIEGCELTFIDRAPIDFHLAASQHDRYCAFLSESGLTVEKLHGNEAYPDSCFVEDTAVVVDELAVICSMGIESRRAETRLIEQELSKYLDIARISLPAAIEGGDVLRIGKKLYVGESSRTNIQGIEELAKLLSPLGYSVISVKTKGGLHLKSACSAINEETILVNPEWVEIAVFEGLNLLYTPADEPGAANVVRAGETVGVQAGFPKTVELIKRVIERVEVIDTSELCKAEGALTCLSIIYQV